MAFERKYSLTLLLLVLFSSIVLLTYAQAQQKPLGGHLASLIGPGTFAAGNYVFPSALSVLGAFTVGGKTVCLADGTNCPTGVTTPAATVETSCVFLGRSIGGANPTVITRPPCLMQPGGCSMRIHSLDPFDGYAIVNMDEIQTDPVGNPAAKSWTSIATGEAQSAGIKHGRFDNGQLEEIVAFFQFARCYVIDDDTSGPGKLRIWGRDGTCKFYVCP